MVSKTSIANIVGWGVILGGIFLTGYHGRRSQSVIYERDNFGNITSAKLHQLGRDEKLIPDPQNPNRLIVQGNPTLDYLCDSIGSGAKWLYDNCQSLRKNDSNASLEEANKNEKTFEYGK
ncbi:Uncharacterised protein [uncultured archaeon]|nr:Uncharacterised protein [uncultured archaeon]